MQRKLSLVAFLLLLSFSASAQKSKNKQKPVGIEAKTADYKTIGSPLPPVRFYLYNGKYLTDAELNNDASLIIMLFNPTCEHCEDEARLFKQHIDLFQRTKLVLVAAPGMEPYLPYFLNNSQIGDRKEIQVGTDSSDFIKNTFLYESLPQINIYDKNRRLIKVFTGETPIEALKPYIE